MLQTPPAFHELDRKPIEQSLLRGLRGTPAEVTHRLDKRLPKVSQPDVIHSHPAVDDGGRSGRWPIAACPGRAGSDVPILRLSHPLPAR